MWAEGREKIVSQTEMQGKRNDPLKLCPSAPHPMRWKNKQEQDGGRGWTQTHQHTAGPDFSRGRGKCSLKNSLEGGRAGGRRRRRKKKKTTLASLGLALSGLPSTRRERACREQDHPCPREASGAVLLLAVAPPLSLEHTENRWEDPTKRKITSVLQCSVYFGEWRGVILFVYFLSILKPTFWTSSFYMSAICTGLVHRYITLTAHPSRRLGHTLCSSTAFANCGSTSQS